jgi:mono/diheme cytochrome c family protein
MGFGGAKDLTASTLSIDQIVNQVTNGKGAMAPYKNLLTPEEIVAVSEYAVSMRKK